MKRVDVLKAELAALAYFQCLSFDLKEAATNYYQHEIECAGGKIGGDG